jgi:hypothetical protein
MQILLPEEVPHIFAPPCNILYIYGMKRENSLTILFFMQIFPDRPKVPPGWLFGSCKDREGLFPANYAEKLPESKGDYVELNPSSSTAQPSAGGGRSVTSIIAALNSQKELPIAMPVVTENAFDTKETNQTPAPVSTHVKISQLSIRCVRNRLVASFSTSCNNPVISSSCYKVVTHNLLTNC